MTIVVVDDEPTIVLMCRRVLEAQGHTVRGFTDVHSALTQLQAAVKAGRLGALTPRFHGAPTNRSQRVTLESDGPELLRRCREDGADVALLVPT